MERARTAQRGRRATSSANQESAGGARLGGSVVSMPEGSAAQCGSLAAMPATCGGAGANTGIDVPAKNAMTHSGQCCFGTFAGAGAPSSGLTLGSTCIPAWWQSGIASPETINFADDTSGHNAVHATASAVVMATRRRGILMVRDGNSGRAVYLPIRTQGRPPWPAPYS